MEREYCHHCKKPKEHQIVNGELIVWCSYCLELKCTTPKCKNKRRSKRALFCNECLRKKHRSRDTTRNRRKRRIAILFAGGKKTKRNPNITDEERRINAIKAQAYRKTEKGKAAMRKANRKATQRYKELYAKATANGQASSSDILLDELS